MRVVFPFLATLSSLTLHSPLNEAPKAASGSEGGKGTEEGASHTPHDGRSGLFIPVPTSVILCLAPTSLRSCRSLPPSSVGHSHSLRSGLRRVWLGGAE